MVHRDLSKADQKAVETVLDFKDRFSSKRWVFERDWFQNCLIYVGQHWIAYESSARRWRRRNMAPTIPTPQSNRFASAVNTIRSVVAQVLPAYSAFPLQDNEMSIFAANSADKYLDVLMREGGIRRARRRMASWVVLTGNAFMASEFDTSPETGTVFVPGETCMDCKTEIAPHEIPESMACPACGSPSLQESIQGVQVPQGRVRISSPSPFEVYVDANVPELDDQEAVLLVHTRPLQSVKRTYPKADDLSADNDRDAGQHFLTALAGMTGSGIGLGQDLSSQSPERVTLYKLYVKSHPEYPDGAYLVMSGDQHVLEVKAPYPFRFRHSERPFFPLDHVKYDDVPGRFWGRTPFDDLAHKQIQRNEVESLIQTMAMTGAAIQWLIPHVVQHTPIGGTPSQIRYNGPPGMKPERLAGLDIPATLLGFLQQIDQDFEELPGSFAALKGKPPGSIRAASAIQMIIDRGMQRYGSVFDNLEEVYENLGIKLLELWRQHAVFPRVQAIGKAAGSYQFMQFLGADIGAIDLRIEAGSTRPKSQAGEEMRLNQLFQWGALNLSDPEQKIKIFERMGALTLLPGAEADVKVVAMENASFMSWAMEATKEIEAVTAMADSPEQALQIISPVLINTFPLRGNIFDHHSTHLVHHRRLALSDEYRRLHPGLQQLYEQHVIVKHLQPLMAEMQSGIPMMSLMSGLPPQPPQGQPGTNAPLGPPTTGAGPGGAIGAPMGREPIGRAISGAKAAGLQVLPGGGR